MIILIVGASGATGRLLVEELLNRGQEVRIVVRSLESLPEKIKNHANLSIIEESILDISHTDMVTLVRGCNAVVSCLGHNLSLQGIPDTGPGPCIRDQPDRTHRAESTAAAWHAAGIQHHLHRLDSG